MLKRAIPALPVKSIDEAASFYEHSLGFTVDHKESEFAIVRRDRVELHLWAASDEEWRRRSGPESSNPVQSGAESFIAGTASCRIEVDEIERLYEEYRSRGVLYDAATVITEQPWGALEFPALDLERNLLTFFQRL